jgi:hypothetical protein
MSSESSGSSNTHNVSNQAKFFKNAISIKLFDKNQVYSRKDIFIGLSDLGTENITRNIDCISQHNSNNNWVVSFNDKFKARDLDSLGIKVINEHVKMEYIDPNRTNDYPVFSVYRIQWLPHNFSHNEIEKYFMKFNSKIKVIGITQETCNYADVDMRHIKNGNIRIKIVHPYSVKDSIKIATGMVYMLGFKIILTNW